MNEKIKKLLEDTNYINEEIQENFNNSSYYRWLNKKLISYKVLFMPCEYSIRYVTPPIKGTVSINKKVRFENNPSLEIKTNEIIKNGFSRSTCGIKISFDKIIVNRFNRVSIWVNISAEGYQNFYFHFNINNIDVVHTASVEIGKWQRIMWEFDCEENIEIDTISITPFLFGCPPEAITNVSFYINKIQVEEVEKDYDLGWQLENRIAYCHAGYFNNSEKIALVQAVDENEFCLLDINNNLVFQNIIKVELSELGIFKILDFTKFKTTGEYKIKIGDVESNYFLINENPYLESILKSINFLRMLRCGEDIDGVHSACHLNCKTQHENGNTVPNFGGWHDAGDVSQFEICTAEMANALLDLYQKIKDEKLKLRILAEAKVGITWLLRTRFNDGSRALAVGYNIWRNNEIEVSDLSVLTSKAEKGPFESFCSASALAVAARCFKDKVFSDWCLRIAKEDFEYARKWYKEGIYTKRWGKNVDSQVCGHALIAAAELYLITKDNYYIDVAIEYSKIVISCQETNYIKNKIRGFFYEDIEHKYILSYEHRGHEQSPIQGLCRIIQVFPKIQNKTDIINTINIYEEYIMSTINYTKPYYLLPGHIYNLNKINYERFTIPSYMCSFEEGQVELKKQIKQGTHIIDDWYLRIFPIAVQRKGFHATLLSKTKAISMIADTLENKQLKNIVLKQLEWILGFNPFATSTMYGEGYNYHPLYVAFSRQIVGSLPVGIMTNNDLDLPYWPTYNNAVFKEIWGHTTGKYLWILADIL